MLVSALLLATLAAGPPPEDAPQSATDPMGEPGPRVAATGPPPAHGAGGFALPILFWLPETKLGFGATGGIHVARDGAPRPTSVFAAAVYTIERQFALDGAVEAYTRGGALLSARARLVHFPDVFYGIGPSSETSARETFTRRSAELVATGELPAAGVPWLRLGPRVELRAEEILDRSPGGALASGAVAGSGGYSAIALGGSVTADTRDSTFWPLRGTFAEAWYVYAPAALGRNGGFGRGVGEVRRFLPLGGGRVLGLHAYAEGAHGTTPFTLLPKLGSTRFLRGIREGRYRDQLDWATQAELRTPVHGPLSATAFAAIGDVAPSLSALTLRHPKLSAGAGLRWRLTDEGANVRVDGAVSRFGPELYVLVLEAF